jgi:uncharacterized protein with PIN domain
MIKLNVSTYGKKDALGFLPADLLANLPKFTGRKDRTEEQIEAMVVSLLEEGQINDLTYRISFDRKPILITGVTRTLAADRINKEGLTDSKGRTYSNEEPFILSAVCKNVSELDALFQTFRENDGDTRTSMTKTDEIEFVTVLNQNYGLTVQQISEKLRKDLAWVTNRLKVVSLDAATLAKLDSGEIKLDTAVALTDIEPEFRAAAVDAANTADGKVTAAGVAEAARKLGAKTGKAIKRSEKQVKDWMKAKINEAPESPAAVLLTALLSYRAGIATLDDLDEAYAAVQTTTEVAVAAAA